uniref:Methyl-accepting chemotaxis protein n=2 Tax=Cohnella candidum TaxID=2674991 RepID=A0A3G3JTU3_9BACL|nr:methyl-accepting chemotaxis protein [Cohnella candidum]
MPMAANRRFAKGFSLHSIGFKLFFIFFISILAFVLAVGLISYDLSRRTIASEVSNSSLQTIVQANEKLDYMFGNYENLSHQIRNNTEFTDQIFTLLNFDVEQVQRVTMDRKVRGYLQNLKLSQPYVTGIYVLNDKGSFGTTDVKIPKDIATKDWYKKAVDQNGKFVWLPPREKGYLGVGSAGESSFAVAQILKNSFDDPIGVLLMEFDPVLLGNTLKKIRLDSGNVLMRDADGTNVASGNDSWTDTPPFAMSGMSGELSLRDGSADLLAVYAKSELTGWALIGLVPKASVYAHADSIYRFTLIAACSAAALALVIGYLLARRIGGPLKRIQDLMKEGAKGNLKVRSGFTRKDEIGELSSSFNQMMSQMTQLIHDTDKLAAAVLGTAGQIVQVSDTTSQTAKEIAAATEEIAAGAVSLTEEASSGNEVTLAANEQLKSVMESNTEVADTAKEVRVFSQEGIRCLGDLTANTSEVERKTGDMAQKVERLRESTKSMEKIFDLMARVNQQTKILSLNAGIEASRVGSAGKGFLVLAQEMQRLAEQSRQSMEVVAGIVDTLHEEIQATSAAILESQPILLAQTGYVHRVNRIFGNVHGHMEEVLTKAEASTARLRDLEQAQETLKRAIDNVTAVSEESSAITEEVASQSAEQSKSSEGLARLSAELKEACFALQTSLTKFQYDR